MTKPVGAVNHLTIKNLRERYTAIWGIEWPHDDEYLKTLWRRAIEENPANRAGFNIRRYEVTINAMREQHDFAATAN